MVTPCSAAERPSADGSAADKGKRSGKPVELSGLAQTRPRLVLPVSPADSHPATRTGFEHYYNLELEQAVRDFERVQMEYPRDPFAVNHLLGAVVVRELLRVGALDTSLYSSNLFITRKEYPIDPGVRERVQGLAELSIKLCDQRLSQHEDDVHALYARGVARALLAGYLGVMQRSWFAALRAAHTARQDHERVLELAPDYLDAKTVVGIHHYIAGSLPWTAKLALSLTGMGGSKSKGLSFLAEAAGAQGATALDARIALALFLRREQRYEQALPLVQDLIQERPRNFFFALEEANLLNAWGQGRRAAEVYRKVLDRTREGGYAQPQPELAAYGLGEALRGQRDFREAAQAYDRAMAVRSPDAELSLRACLAAGEMYDALGDRTHALDRYRTLLDSAPSGSVFHSTARKRLREPYSLR